MTPTTDASQSTQLLFILNYHKNHRYDYEAVKFSQLKLPAMCKIPQKLNLKND